MTNRELLEFAAKAFGYSCWQSKHGYLNVTRPDGSKFTACHNWPKFDNETGEKLPEPGLVDALSADNWNSLADDGDALRLAVKLHLVVHHELNMGEWHAEAYSLPDDDGRSICQTVPHCDDPSAATRLAITYVAAVIGKALP